MSESPYGRSIKWLIVIMIIPEEFGTARETVRLALEAENIESRPVWKPMHMQPVFNPQITQIFADHDIQTAFQEKLSGAPDEAVYSVCLQEEWILLT